MLGAARTYRAYLGTTRVKAGSARTNTSMHVPISTTWRCHKCHKTSLTENLTIFRNVLFFAMCHATENTPRVEIISMRTSNERVRIGFKTKKIFSTNQNASFGGVSFVLVLLSGSGEFNSIGHELGKVRPCPCVPMSPLVRTDTCMR